MKVFRDENGGFGCSVKCRGDGSSCVVGCL